RPPPYPKAELVHSLIKHHLQLVSTAHCPFDFEGQKDLGKGDFRKVPNGLPGVEDRVDLLHDGGVVAGRITRERWVEIIATAPAKLFGMFPRKGAIAVGSDADVVVYDPTATRTISAKTHHMDVDYSCYEGGPDRRRDPGDAPGRPIRRRVGAGEAPGRPARSGAGDRRRGAFAKAAGRGVGRIEAPAGRTGEAEKADGYTHRFDEAAPAES